MPRPFQFFSQPDYLIHIVDINSHTELQTMQIQISWLLRSQLIWIYIVCKGRVYPGSAGQGLRRILFGDNSGIFFSYFSIKKHMVLGRTGENYTRITIKYSSP